MKIKTYQARTMQEAIKLIKADLGPDAVILSTKSVRATSGTAALIGRNLVEVTAAIDVAEAQLSEGKVPAASAAENAPPVKSAKRAPSTPPSRAATPPSNFSDTLREELAPSHPTPRRLAQAEAAYAASKPEADPMGSGRLEQMWSQMKEEMGRLRELVETVNRSRAEMPTIPPPNHGEAKQDVRSYRNMDLVAPSAPPPAGEGKQAAPAVAAAPPKEPLRETRRPTAARLEAVPAKIERQLQALLDSGVQGDYAKHLLATLRERGGQIDLTSDAGIRQALQHTLARDIATAGPLLGLGDWKKTVILVGPTGAGKTTTIAKLASHYRLKEQRHVVLVTLDTYRMAAVEQLRGYAQLLHVPFEVALTRGEAADLIHRHHKAEVILVDTAGRSPRDSAGVQELKRLISLDHPVETHLVVSAATKDRDLIEAHARFSEIPLHRLLVTKVDETASYGGIVNLMQRTKLPLSYLGVGQGVPEDLLVAKPDLVADLVLGGDLPLPMRTSGTTAGVR